MTDWHQDCMLNCTPAFIRILYLKLISTKNKTKGMNTGTNINEQYETLKFCFEKKTNI